MIGNWSCFKNKIVRTFIYMNRFIFFPLFIFFFCLATKVTAQTGTIKIEKPKPETPKTAKDSVQKTLTTFDVYYGYKVFIHDFQGKFNTLQNFDISSPIQLIGLGESGPILINRVSGTYYGHILYNQVVPQSLYINDTIKSKITGFVFGLACGGYFNSKSENFYFNFYLGFNTGRLRFYENELIRQKNQFFSPKIGIHPRFHIKKFTIGIIAEAEYDISKTSWKKMAASKGEKIIIDKFKQTAGTVSIGISYRFLKHGNIKGDQGGFQIN